MTNRWIWFNIGQKGLHNVTWQCAVIRADFDPSTIRFEDCKFDEEDNPYTEWVSKNELSYTFHRSVANEFKDLNQVAEWVKRTYESGEDLYVGNSNWLHIYNVFDLDVVNEYGIAVGEWD